MLDVLTDATSKRICIITINNSIFFFFFDCLSASLDSPKNTHVLVSPRGDMREGSFANLSCVSHANPPANRYEGTATTKFNSTTYFFLVLVFFLISIMILSWLFTTLKLCKFKLQSCFSFKTGYFASPELFYYFFTENPPALSVIKNISK